jgi:hypothetical protein
MIKSIENFIEAVRADSTSWNPKEPKWFRGEPRSLTPLLPTLYREGRWPGTPITLRQGARVIEDSRHLRLAWSDKGQQEL